jgi:hypothetical protein
MVTTKDSMAKNTRKSRSDYILGLASKDPQLEINCRIVEEVLHTLQSCHELTTQTPKGLHVLMGWLTKHYRKVFLHYVSKPPRPFVYYLTKKHTPKDEYNGQNRG